MSPRTSLHRRSRLGELPNHLIEMRGVRTLDQDAIALARIAAHPIPCGRPALDQLGACCLGEDPRAFAVEDADSVKDLRGPSSHTPVRLLRQDAKLGHLA